MELMHARKKLQAKVFLNEKDLRLLQAAISNQQIKKI